MLCIYKDEIGKNNPDSVPDSEPSQLDLEPDIATAQTTVVATSAAFSLPNLTATTSTTTLGKPAARKRRQSEFEAQSTKSMECIQSLIKARLEKTPEDEDDVFGKMVACECKKIKNSRIKRNLKKKISDLMFEGVEEDETISAVTASDEQKVQFFVMQPGQQLTTIEQ